MKKAFYKGVYIAMAVYTILVIIGYILINQSEYNINHAVMIIVSAIIALIVGLSIRK
jgi:hypothetical protein